MLLVAFLLQCWIAHDVHQDVGPHESISKLACQIEVPFTFDGIFIRTACLGRRAIVSTNVDDIFVLIGFFADPKFRARDIVIGQYAGITARSG